jgi:hypothetical protein
MHKRRGEDSSRRRRDLLAEFPVELDRPVEPSLDALPLNSFGNWKNDMTLLPLKLNSGVRKRIAHTPG